MGMVMLELQGEGVCEALKLGVREEFRGKGVGRALMEAVIQAARDAGQRRMVLTSNHKLKDALRLYEDFGFQYVEYSDKWVPALRRPDGAGIMKRPVRLKAGDTVAVVSLSWGGPGGGGAAPPVFDCKAAAGRGLRPARASHAPRAEGCGLCPRASGAAGPGPDGRLSG